MILKNRDKIDRGKSVPHNKTKYKIYSNKTMQQCSDGQIDKRNRRDSPETNIHLNKLVANKNGNINLQRSDGKIGCIVGKKIKLINCPPPYEKLFPRATMRFVSTPETELFRHTNLPHIDNPSLMFNVELKVIGLWLSNLYQLPKQPFIRIAAKILSLKLDMGYILKSRKSVN